ncbi:GNAT family N-acetyltransferase [Enterobacter mori]|uniref:GNAT family N-acetyltransferase n=1 Tax=Enterobacter mori TaxID=539813 RepID=UPI0021B10E7D|nr:GNAT family N-acetyltransferase [Enterobacter mori]UWX93465.1 GNAT family N-acetyltransferase [Enterobacter mori]
MHVLKSYDKKAFEDLKIDVPSSIGKINLLILDNYSDFQNSHVKKLFENADNYYPNFNNWYNHKLVKDVVKDSSVCCDYFNNHLYSDEVGGLSDLNFPTGRFVIAASVDENLAGLSVLKKHPSEYKISTFFVDDKYSGFGLGTLLLNCSLSVLRDKGVNITVSEGALDKMVPFLTKNGFKEYKSIVGEYYKNKKETHFVKK